MRVVDLSMTLGGDSIALPGQQPIAYRLIHTHEEHGRTNATLFFNIHEGTHIDPPYHFIADGQTIDEIPVETLIAPGFLFRLESVHVGRPITLDQLLAGADPPDQLAGYIVIIDSGWDDLAQGDQYYGPDAPYLSQEVADWLVAKNVRAVGLTNPPDQVGPAREGIAPVHRTLLGGGVLIIENLTHLDGIPRDNFWVIALPIKIHRGCGGPARVVVIQGGSSPLGNGGT